MIGSTFSVINCDEDFQYADTKAQMGISTPDKKITNWVNN